MFGNFRISVELFWPVVDSRVLTTRYIRNPVKSILLFLLISNSKQFQQESQPTNLQLSLSNTLFCTLLDQTASNYLVQFLFIPSVSTRSYVEIDN